MPMAKNFSILKVTNYGPPLPDADILPGYDTAEFSQLEPTDGNGS